MPHRSLLPLAFALSLALHGSVLLPGMLPKPAAAPTPPPLQALLRPPPAPSPPPAEPLLKDTLAETAPPGTATPPPRPERPRPTATRQAVRAAQQKLSEHLFYPPEAVARGLEGEVRLLVTLDAGGGVADVQIAASSGQPLLDNAAIRAAWAMGRAEAGVRELILPVVFRLQ